jgi:hypothetical protein
MIEARIKNLAEKFWMNLAWLLPKELVKWAAVRLIANATTGQFADTVVPELSAMDALQRWDYARD